MDRRTLLQAVAVGLASLGIPVYWTEGEEIVGSGDTSDDEMTLTVLPHPILDMNDPEQRKQFADALAELSNRRVRIEYD